MTSMALTCVVSELDLMVETDMLLFISINDIQTKSTIMSIKCIIFEPARKLGWCQLESINCLGIKLVVMLADIRQINLLELFPPSVELFCSFV